MNLFRPTRKYSILGKHIKTKVLTHDEQLAGTGLNVLVMVKAMNDLTTYTDEQLLMLLSESDQAAFTELYNRYHSGIYRYQLTFVKIPSVAEDLTQEIFLKIWESRFRVKVHTSFAAYIYRASRNTAIDFLKKVSVDRKLINEIIQYCQSEVTDSTSNSLMAKEYHQLYQQAIGSLSKQGRIVFLLCREEGKTYEEVSRILGISRYTVKEHMTRSLRNLREFLGEKTKATLQVIILFMIT